VKPSLSVVGSASTRPPSPSNGIGERDEVKAVAPEDWTVTLDRGRPEGEKRVSEEPVGVVTFRVELVEVRKEVRKEPVKSRDELEGFGWIDWTSEFEGRPLNGAGENSLEESEYLRTPPPYDEASSDPTGEDKLPPIQTTPLPSPPSQNNAPTPVPSTPWPIADTFPELKSTIATFRLETPPS
jgi:hypothetical protein